MFLDLYILNCDTQESLKTLKPDEVRSRDFQLDVIVNFLHFIIIIMYCIYLFMNGI